jgi:hypothetical protein
LLAKKIAEDNDMSRRSQDPFDSGFLQQRDAKQNTQSNYSFAPENNPKGKMIQFMTKETFNKKFPTKDYDKYLDEYDIYLNKYLSGQGLSRTSSDVRIGRGMKDDDDTIHIDINSHNAKGLKAKTGMGFFDDLAEDLRPVKHHGMPLKPARDRPIPKEMQTVGEGLRSRKKSKDHVSRRAFDEYIKNEMDRMARKDLAESRAVRGGKKAKPAGGYGYGLKGSPEMAEKMAKLRAMKKK